MTTKKTALSLLVLVLATACDPAPQVANRDITIPETVPDRLACLDAWNCAAGCVQPFLDGSEGYAPALVCAEACEQGSPRARGLFLSWVVEVEERCPDAAHACVLEQWHPRMGTGAYLSTCLAQ